MHWDIPILRSEKFRKLELPKTMFLLENVIFQGLGLSLGPFIVDLLTFIDYPSSNSFFQWEF